MGRQLILVATAVVVAFVASACSGDSTSAGSELGAVGTTSTTGAATTTSPPAPVWQIEELGGSGQRTVVAAASAEGTAVIVAADEDSGRIDLWADQGDGFTPTAAAPTIDGRAEPAAITANGRGFVLAITVRNDDDTATQIWRSDDGSTWRIAPELTPEGEVEVTDFHATDDGLVAVGLRRTSDPDALPFDPAMWFIDDTGAADVTPAASMSTIGYGFVADVEPVGDRLLAVGADADRQAAWWSDDGGRTWTPGDLSTVSAEGWLWAVDIAVLGDRLVLSATGEDQIHIGWSVDGAVSWQGPAELTAAATSGELHAADGALWITGSRFSASYDDLARCYVDLAGCDGAVPVVLRSEDGAEWRVVDLDTETFRPVEVLDRHGGVSIVGASSSSGAVIVSTWSGDAPLPTSAIAELPTDDGPRFVRWDAELTVGETVRFPLYTHCGIGYLAAFNDRHWYLDGNEGGLPSPAPDDAWPMAQESVLGLATLVDDTTIEYSLPSGEVIGRYVASDVEPFGCD